MNIHEFLYKLDHYRVTVLISYQYSTYNSKAKL